MQKITLERAFCTLANSIKDTNREEKPPYRPFTQTTVAEALAKFKDKTYAPPVAKVRALVASGASEDDVKAEKENLRAYTFHATFYKKIKAAYAVGYTGLAIVDVDGKDLAGTPLAGKSADELRALMASDPHTLAAFVGPSGTGIKALVQVAEPLTVVNLDTGEVENDVNGLIEAHRKRFSILSAYLNDRYGLPVDPSGSNLNRFCYVTHDPALYLNPDALPFDVEAYRAKYAPAPTTPTAQATAPKATATARTQTAQEGITPFDQYDAEATTETIASLLLSAGWTHYQDDLYTRPGKTSGTSGQIKVDPNGKPYFVCYTSNAAPLVPNGPPYWPSRLLIDLKYNGNATDAARDVAREQKRAGTRPQRKADATRPSAPQHDAQKAAQAAPGEPAPEALPETEEAATVTTGPPELAWVPYPTHLLPVYAQGIVRETARAKNIDEGMIGPQVLTALAAGVGNSYRLRVRSDWAETSILFTALVAPSGSTKSPALDAAIGPALELERAEDLRYREDMKAYEADLSRWRAEPPKNRRAEPKEPPRYRRILQDATFESLIHVHEQNPRGLLATHDELGQWLASFNEYKKGGGDEARWLKIYGGRALMVDRKTGNQGRQQQTFLHRPHVCLIGVVPPGGFRAALSTDRLGNGFAFRLLAVMPPQRKRKFIREEPNADDVARYRYLVHALYGLKVALTDVDETEYIGLDPDALTLHESWHNQNGELAFGAQEAIQGLLHKVEGYPLRFALTLHLCEYVEAQHRGDVYPLASIPAETMRRAVDLAVWHRRELLRLYFSLNAIEESKPVTRDEKTLAALPERFTWEDVAKAHGCTRRAAFDVVKRLIQTGRIEAQKHGQYRKRGFTLEVPALSALSALSAPPDPANPQNDPVDAVFGPAGIVQESADTPRTTALSALSEQVLGDSYSGHSAGSADAPRVPALSQDAQTAPDGPVDAVFGASDTQSADSADSADVWDTDAAEL